MVDAKQIVGSQFVIHSFPGLEAPIDSDSHFMILSEQDCPPKSASTVPPVSLTEDGTLDFGLVETTATSFDLCYCNNQEGSCRDGMVDQYTVFLGAIVVNGQSIASSFYPFSSTALTSPHRMNIHFTLQNVFKINCLITAFVKQLHLDPSTSLLHVFSTFFYSAFCGSYSQVRRPNPRHSAFSVLVMSPAKWRFLSLTTQ